MRRRRPASAPRGDTGASVVPLSRANLVREDAEDAGRTAPTQTGRPGGPRSRFAELTPAMGITLPDGTRAQRGTSRAPARARRANPAPEPHDGWTFVLIPPGAGARPRTLRVSVRRLRFAVASFCVVVGTTLATGGLLVLALSFLPPAQDEVRGVELGVFASALTELTSDSARAESITPAAIAAASAGAAAPRGPTPRSRPTARATRGGDRTPVNPGIMESLPVVGEITSRFARARRHPLLGVVRKHAGIDIAAPAGTHITAPADGRVTFSGRKFGYGYTVEIDHGNGVTTRYAHCRSLMVRVGDEVAQGAVIATVGRSGLATAPHLHYEVLVRSRSVDPLRTSLTSLLEGKEPATPSASPQPIDSALRSPPQPGASAPEVPVVPDEDELLDIPEVDVPPVRSASRDTIVARTSAVLAPSAGVLPPPPAPARDTAKKS